MRKIFKHNFDAFGLVALAALVGLFVPLLVGNLLEPSLGLPSLYRLRGTRTSPSEIVIVALDEESARKLKHEARADLWPRSQHAELIERLNCAGAAVIGFDLLFGRPRKGDEDIRLARAISAAGNVILVEEMHRERLVDRHGNLIAVKDTRVQAVPEIRAGALVSAPFVLPKEDEGIGQYHPFPSISGGDLSLPVAMSLVMQREQYVSLTVDGLRLPKSMGDVLLRIAERKTTCAGAAVANLPRRSAPAPWLHTLLQTPDRQFINLYGPPRTVHTISYAAALDLLRFKDAHETFGGRAVFVGLAEANQPAQRDAYRTPYTTREGVDISGVELGATVLGNLLDGSALQRPVPGMELLGGIAMAAGLALVWLRLATGWAIVTTLVVQMLYGVLAVQFFGRYNLWLPLIVPGVVLPILVSLLGFYYAHRRAAKRQLQLSEILSRYLPRQAIARLSDEMRGQGEDGIVYAVCLCSDIEGYSTLAEGLAPEQLRATLNRYFEAFMPAIKEHGGEVVDIVGDAVMSIWVSANGQAGRNDVCARALAATRNLHRQLNMECCEGALPTRFGLHFGQIFFGEVGAHDHREIRVVGDIVNTASRIQAANKWLGTRILASHEVVAECMADDVRTLGKFRLVGKMEPLGLCAVDSGQLPSIEQTLFAQGLDAFAAGSIEAAGVAFQTILCACPEDGPAKAYAKRCAEMLDMPQQTPPDGVFVADAK